MKKEKKIPEDFKYELVFTQKELEDNYNIVAPAIELWCLLNLNKMIQKVFDKYHTENGEQ